MILKKGLINTAVFEKTIEKVRKHRDIKLIATKKEETTWFENQTIIKMFL